MSFKSNSAFVGKIREEKHSESLKLLLEDTLLAFSINDSLRRQVDFYQLDLHFWLIKNDYNV
uniref:Putative ovule protein n=1 Tax=Solanum chacoense TaxID=4108 RepID=A0A0V0H3D3_SOLCH